MAICSNPAHAGHAGIISLGGIGVKRDHEPREWFAVDHRRRAGDGHMLGAAAARCGHYSASTENSQQAQADSKNPHANTPVVLPRPGVAAHTVPRNTKTWYRRRLPPLR